MTRSQKITKAQQLRDQGLTYREIGERLGVSRTTVGRWLIPAVAAADRQRCRDYKDRNREALRAKGREYKRTHKAECPQCGGEMDRGTARCGGKCATCRADDRDRRARLIEQWWRAGWPRRKIAGELGWSLARLGTEVARLRDLGYRLPYRRPTFPAGKPKHPELAEARL